MDLENMLMLVLIPNLKFKIFHRTNDGFRKYEGSFFKNFKKIKLKGASNLN